MNDSGKKRGKAGNRAPIDPNETHDLLIIGGGISGAALLWDATLRGMKALLVEKNDYASGTSQATSKLIHGGLRYLKNGEIGLVRESLRERRTLAKIAPHAVRPLGFLFPIYKGARVGRAMLGAALSAYDALAYDRNRGVPSDRRMPGSRHLSAVECLAEEPGLIARDLKGGYLYYDYLNVNPERLCFEFILSAREKGARARNYTRVTAVEPRAQGGFDAALRDELNGSEYTVRARAVINASGPWADELVRLGTRREATRLIRSKGIHVVTRAINREKAIALIKPDGKHFFIIPWRGKSIIGTTDTRFEDHPDNLRVTRGDVEGLLDTVNSLYQSANLTLSDVDYFYGGIRPITDDSAASTYDASRKTEIVDHGEHGTPGFFTVLGGKYTTSRALAEEALDRVVDFLPGSFAPCRTEGEPLAGGHFADTASLEHDLMREYPRADYEKISLLVSRY